MVRICVICGREFTPAKKSTATTCSRDCWRQLMRRNAVLPVRQAQKHVRICENCGREFVVTGYSVRKTCSKTCQKEQIARKVQKTLLDRYGNLLTKTCPVCGREFSCKRFKQYVCCSSIATTRSPVFGISSRPTRICVPGGYHGSMLRPETTIAKSPGFGFMKPLCAPSSMVCAAGPNADA